MRILWFTNSPLGGLKRHWGQQAKGSGSWMHALLEPILASGEVELGVATLAPGQPEGRIEEDGVTYFNVTDSKLLDAYGLFRSRRLRRNLAALVAVAHDWQPDLIHVHGTERLFGLIRTRGGVQTPTVVSIQGLIEQCHRHALGVMGWPDILRNLTWRDLIMPTSSLAIRPRYRKHIPVEREILRGVDAFIGRTGWDRAHTRAYNSNTPYYHIDEMMRPDFYHAPAWSLGNANQDSIMTTSKLSPLKGLPVLLEAVAILRHWRYPVQLTVAGVSADDMKTAVGRFVARRVSALGIGDAVKFVGWQPPERLVDHFQASRCFVTPSFIENSCNALSEAQLVGLPCVASHAGGLPTLVENEHTGLSFEPGDAAMLAVQIERVLTDEALAQRLGAAGRRAALQRHEPERIVSDLLRCYRQCAATAAPAGGAPA